jgi:antitoxin VapB
MRTMLAEGLMERDILPSVYLTAVDDRIRSYRHAVPREGVLDRFGMLNFCARRWGLSVSMTRFVHFGAMPRELEEKFDIVAQVNAELQAATREGRTADELFSIAKRAYASAGHTGEEKMHHQGGAAGYLEREWLARPGGTEVCGRQQAFAWNPSLDGAKVEDTILLHNGSIEVITRTSELPSVETLVDGTKYSSAGVLRIN